MKRYLLMKSPPPSGHLPLKSGGNTPIYYCDKNERTGIGENCAKNTLEWSVKNKTLFERVQYSKHCNTSCEFVLFRFIPKYSAQFYPSLDLSCLPAGRWLLLYQGKSDKKGKPYLKFWIIDYLFPSSRYLPWFFQNPWNIIFFILKIKDDICKKNLIVC